MKIIDTVRKNVRDRLAKALESFTMAEIAKAYGCELPNFCIIFKKIDENKKVNLSTVVRINKALDKLEGRDERK